MTPDLSDRDRERFAAMRERLEDVEPASPEPRRPVESRPFDPMLARTFDGELGDVDEKLWIGERKFDGTRIVLQKFDGEVALYTRRHIDRADTLSALAEHCETRLPDGLILDGEYCFLTPDGTSRFLPIHQTGDTVEREGLTARYFVFDVLATDGEWHVREALLDRKERLGAVVDSDEWVCPVEPVEAGFRSFYDRMIERGEEGMMLKRRSSPYHPGVRSAHWQKVKSFAEADLLAVGFTEGEGRRSGTFGALVLTDGEDYVGRVGSGFDRETLETLRSEMEIVEAYPVSPDDVGRAYTPIEPMVVRVKFQEVNRDGKLRAPVFLGRRLDKPVEEVRPLAPS